MKISRSEYELFDAQFRLKSRKGGEWEPLRYGQAWYNYFHLQKHTAESPEERKLLDSIYEIRQVSHARAEILIHFTDSEN